MTDETPPPSPDARTSGARALDAVSDALRFFTRLPAPAEWTEPSPAWRFDGVAVAAPVAGLLVGALSGAVLAAGLRLGLPALASAAIGTALGVALSGALHLDGLADVADGFGGGKTRPQKLEIMRDSRIGTFGAAAVALALITRVALIAALAERLGPGGAVAALIAAAAFARPVALVPAVILAPARLDGTGHAARPKPRSVVAGCLLGGAVALAFGGIAGGFGAIASGLAAGLGVVALAIRHVGGFTGDVCGAASELAEIAALAALVAVAA